MDYLAKEALIFLAEQETTLWERFKKYLADNREFFVMAALAMGGSYYAYGKMLNSR